MTQLCDCGCALKLSELKIGMVLVMCIDINCHVIDHVVRVGSIDHGGTATILWTVIEGRGDDCRDQHSYRIKADSTINFNKDYPEICYPVKLYRLKGLLWIKS